MSKHPRSEIGLFAPEIVRPQVAAETRELCFRQFSVVHSGVSRTPLAVAEHLMQTLGGAVEGGGSVPW